MRGAEGTRRRSAPNTSASFLFGLVIDTTLCLPVRISEKSCPAIQGAVSLRETIGKSCRLIEALGKHCNAPAKL